jgi:dolichol-phosphate mannosyltransferase
VINKEKSFLSAVVYIHNDAERLSGFFSRLIFILEDNFEKYEVVCVDDASDDSGVDCIKEFKRKIKNGIINVINMSYYQGLELSMNAGLDLAIGDFVFEFDTVLMDYPDDLIINLFKRLLEGYDICSAGCTRQKLSSQFFYWFFNRNSRLQRNITSESFRILSRRAINRVRSMSVSFPYRKAIYANSGLKMDFLVYKPIGSTSGRKKSEWSRERWETAFSSLILFTDIAYRASIVITTLMMGATICGVVYTLVIFFLRIPLPGWTTTMLVVTASFFAVFALLSIIIKYLSVLIDLVFKKRRYMVESVDKL